MDSITTGYDWWEYFLIPWIAGLVGYITNVLALRMVCYPIEFCGLELFRVKGESWGIIGWQGVIPTKAEKIASITFELMTTRLLDTTEIFGRLDPKRFSQVMDDGVLLMMDNIINEVANEYMPSAWKALPKEVKDEIVTMAETPVFMEGFMRDMQEHIEDVVDIKNMTVAACVKEKHLVVTVFEEVGNNKEFIFIR